MNKEAREYWKQFWFLKIAPKHVVAEAFGQEGSTLADEIASLIV